MTKPKLIKGDDGEKRCWWCGTDADYVRYHDEEWGLPVDDDQRLFEKLSLEGFQAGLSWLTILRKRENFRRAFLDFDFYRIARFNTRSVNRLLKDAGIVRHRGKIEAVIRNAKLAVGMVDEFGSLGAFIWRFEPKKKSFDLPSSTPESIQLSKELKKRSWSFVGPTTVYAFMQAMGLVNDHVPGCFVYRKVERARREFAPPSMTRSRPESLEQ